MTSDIQQIPLTDTIHSVHLTRLPMMPAMFCRLMISALGKHSRLPGPGPVTKARLHLTGVSVDWKQIDRYRRVCGFSHPPNDPVVPPGFLQTLFIGLLGRYIASDFFPINPMGLIQTAQQFESRRPVRINDPLDLSCTLDDMTVTARGTSTRFLLEIYRENQVVWQGFSTYLTRTRSPENRPGKKFQDRPLPTLMTIRVPSGTGREYARVSGDYNPHHLSDVTARIIGFKRAMAHGMWSLARTLACLERSTKFATPCLVETAFKLPVYLPATLSVGKKAVMAGDGRHQVFFDLRDAVTRRPHLKGRVTHPGKMS
ncbi:MAG: MaoC family dehydratase [Desulfotignum sp.]